MGATIGNDGIMREANDVSGHGGYAHPYDRNWSPARPLTLAYTWGVAKSTEMSEESSYGCVMSEATTGRFWGSTVADTLPA